MSDKIAAGIVLFNPNIKKLSAVIDSLKEQLINICLVDNASDNISEVEQLYEDKKSEKIDISLIKNSKNKGIATALNQIMNNALHNGFDWVLCFDQDSLPPKKLLSELSKYIGLNNVGIVSPRIMDIHTGRYLYNDGEDKSKESLDYQLIDKCITSGSLVSVKAWSTVGRYDEYLFIDYVDFDFCIRMRKMGYKIVQANKIVMKHELGNMKVKRLLFKKVAVMNHKAMRKYYMTRNRIYCEYKYYNRFGLRNLFGIIKTIILVIFYEEDKYKKIKAIMKGLSDGMKDSKKFRTRKKNEK